MVDLGNTVVIIEHHLDVIKNADYVIDLGPGAGKEGGYIIGKGTPEEISEIETSITGKYIKETLSESQESLLVKVSYLAV